MFTSDRPLDPKQVKHEMMSKAAWIDYRAKVWFERPAYGKYTGRRDSDGQHDPVRQSGVHYSDEGAD